MAVDPCVSYMIAAGNIQQEILRLEDTKITDPAQEAWMRERLSQLEQMLRQDLIAYESCRKSHPIPTKHP